MISIRAVDTDDINRTYISASLIRTGDLRLSLSGQEPLNILCSNWNQFSNHILSNIRPTWNVPTQYQDFHNQTKHQVFVSLIHLASQINNDIIGTANHNSRDFESIYFGRVFEDNLPTRNKLIVLPIAIQNELRANQNVVNELMKWGRIYECTLQIIPNFVFYYKPYNVPVGLPNQLSTEAEIIFNEIQDFHRSVI